MDSNLESKMSFLIDLKVKKLQRESLASLKYNQVERALMNTKWQKRIPMHLCEIASDIDSLTVEDVVNYLTKESLVSKDKLETLASMFEGD